MLEYFDIFGTPIPYAEIKEFRIVQKEYIYRPVYEEYTHVESGFFSQTATKRFRYVAMAPYAAIIDESDRRWIFSGKSKNFKEKIGVELLNDVRETVGNVFNIKAIKGKRYLCMNQTGRFFQTYLDEIPVLVRMEDGRPVEVDRNDSLFMELGNTIVPTVNIVPALMIRAKENYIFWGNGIQIKDIGKDYKRLQLELSEYKQQKAIAAKEKKTIEIKEVSIPKLPKIDVKKNSIDILFKKDR